MVNCGSRHELALALHVFFLALRAPIWFQEISKAVEPKDGKPGTVPPNQEREGYVADLDE